MIGDAQITVGDLTSFLFYAVYIGVSMTGANCFMSRIAFCAVLESVRQQEGSFIVREILPL